MAHDALQSPHAWAPLVSRRDLLRVASVGLAGTLLPGLRAAQSATAEGGSAKSVILLWLAGGVTHIDSFDPKPHAPLEIRGSLTSIPTTLPGIRFCEPMSHLARQTDRLALLRSFVPATDDHFLGQVFALSGRRVGLDRITAEPNVGAVVSRLLGPRNGLPGYIAVPGTTRPGPPPVNMFTGGWLGREYGPFPTGGTPRNDDFTARVSEAPEEEFHRQSLTPPTDSSPTRLDGRRSLRRQLDAGLRQLEGAGLGDVLHRQYTSAFDMLLSPSVRRAFDLRQEADAVRQRYGQTKIGQRCLLARRLVEAGARFVMVDYGYDPDYGNLWDNHNAPGQNFPHICEMVKRDYHLAGTDRACAALLDDLAARGMLESTLVVFLTEFGRTPTINKLGGRDHWGKAGSIFFAGGGVRGGQVIGSTDAQAAVPRGMAYSSADVAATIYKALGIPLDTELRDRQDRPIALLPEGRPIPGVL
ncbi:MAG: DUF1501 domain-containing protein [Gemmataceae bacterium]